MAEVQDGYGYTTIGTVGTILLSNRATTLVRAVIPGTYVGTVAIYDTATAAGTAVGNQVVSFGLPATGIPQAVEIGAQLKNGLVYASTGTPNIVLIWN
jgi:hypothetical protein